MTTLKTAVQQTRAPLDTSILKIRLSKLKLEVTFCFCLNMISSGVLGLKVLTHVKVLFESQNTGK